MSPAKFIRRKVPAPSEMLTRDWDRVQQDVRERSFFMAAVNRAEILDVFQSASEDVASGKVSKSRAREVIRQQLATLGYVPAPGTEGGIKDLTSLTRINTVLDTNERNTQGYFAYRKQLAAARIFPAKRMVRLTQKREPRNWPQRWRQASAALPSTGINVADMSAHITHPIWPAINRFGNAYPLYDFGSGMGDAMIRLDEADPLGVATPPAAQELSPVHVPVDMPSVGTLAPSLNASLEASPAIRTAAVREALTSQLQGAGRWETGPDGQDRFVYLDPNGTRPDTPQNLASIVRARPYPDAPLYQYEAAAQYVQQGAESFTRGSDALYDLARLVHRTQPMESAPPLWGQRIFDTVAALEEFVTALETGLPSLPGWPFLTLDEDPARAIANVPEGALVITLNRARTARDLRPLLATLGEAAAEVPGVFLESGTRLRVLRRQVVGGITQIVCEEVKP